jgi:hypothetical protein
MLRTKLVILALLVTVGLVGVVQAAATPADVYVSPSGNDAWSGKLAAPSADGKDGPLATVAKAQQTVRALAQREPNRDQPIVVALRGGTYSLEKTIVFEPEDSGASKAPIIYRAYGDERPVLSGGVRIAGWKKTPQGWWQAKLEGVGQGKWDFAQLFVDDQRRFRPRLPKQGYYHIAAQVAPGAQAGGRGDDRFGFSGDEIRADWSNLKDVEVLSFHQWSMSRLPIASVDAKGKVVTLSGHSPGADWWGKFIKGHRFLVENVKEALGEPGQWYLDRPTGTLTYVPRPGETPESTVVVAPRIDELLVFRGDVKAKRWVHDIRWEGITLAHANWATPPTGIAFAQAEIGLHSAVSAIGARNIVLARCAIRNVGAYAVAFGLGCKHNRLEDCEMVDLGGGGVKLGQAGSSLWEDSHRVPDDPDLLCSHQTVRNCTIAHAGRLHPAAIGVWIGHSPYNVVEHNDVYDLYYSSMSVGWVWGYAPSQAHHNDIGFNHMHTIGQCVLSDMGGVYTLGTAPGTRVHDNHIHDVQSYEYGGWGLYTDEGSTHVLMENNLVYRTRDSGFHQHYGKENRIQNNIFAFGAKQQLQRTRTEPHTSFWFERNIVYWTQGPLLGSNWADNNYKLDNNLYWNAAGKPVTFVDGMDLKAWREKRGQDLHSKIADPKFVAPEKGDFRLQPDSPALALGFKPFDYSKAGRQTPRILTNDLPPVPRGFESPTPR